MIPIPSWLCIERILKIPVFGKLYRGNAFKFCALARNTFFTSAKVLRDGHWSEQDASILVPGDIISIKLGDIVPADARLLEGDPLKIDQVS